MHKAQASNAVIYTIGLIEPDSRDANPGLLKELSLASGGELYRPKDSDGIAEVLDKNRTRHSAHLHDRLHADKHDARRRLPNGAGRRRRTPGRSLVVRSRTGTARDIHTVITMLKRALGFVLILVGMIALSWVGFHFMSAAWFDRQAREALASVRQPPKSEAAPTPDSMGVGKPIGTLEITRVGLTGVVVEGDSDAVLDRAIGHLPDTPLPWKDGNSALAAHRDTIFRPLKGVRLGDVLRLKTPHGDFEYRVAER